MAVDDRVAVLDLSRHQRAWFLSVRGRDASVATGASCARASAAPCEDIMKELPYTAADGWTSGTALAAWAAGFAERWGAGVRSGGS
jgi:hypothetical protein